MRRRRRWPPVFIHPTMLRQISFGIMQVALLALLGCESSSRAAGQVRDARGKPLADVVVRLEIGSTSKRTRTDASGFYSVTRAKVNGKSPADLTYCKAGYRLARRWFDDSNSIPPTLDVILGEIDTTDTPARIAGARAPCEALGVVMGAPKPNVP
jgi:hypothetical protein